MPACGRTPECRDLARSGPRARQVRWDQAIVAATAVLAVIGCSGESSTGPRLQEPVAGESAGYPNEPAGFTRIFEADFSELPPDLGSGPVSASASGAVLAGAWTSDKLVPPDGSSGQIIDAPDAFSAGKALRVEYPAGLGAGSGNGKIYAWGPEGSALTGQATARRIPEGGYELKEMYASYRVRMASGTYDGWWELNRAGQLPRMKNYGYISVGNGSSPSTADLYIVGASNNWENDDPDCASDTWGCGRVPDFYVKDAPQQSPIEPGERLGDPGVGTTVVNSDATVIDVDRWHHIEIYFKISSAPDVADAEIKVWVDGTLVYHVTDFKSRTAAPDNRGVFGLHLNPVISGGGGDTSKRWTDYIDWDHVYVSGIRLESY